MSQHKLAILLLGLIAALFLATTTSAASMYVGGKEYQLDPNIPAMYQYIDMPDPSFQWTELIDIPPVESPNGYVSYFVEFTSQQWLTEQEISRSVWKHNLTIVIPKKMDLPTAGSIYITGCRNGGLSCGATDRPEMEKIAVKSGMPMAILHQVPNALMTWANDPLQLDRTEDALVAYSWAQFVKNPSRPDNVVYFPMAKAAVMAARVFAEWSRSHPEIMGTKPMEQFYFTGASKRGAATWFAAAYMGQYQPKHILGAAPLVFDTLNFTHTIPTMYQQLGGWTFAFDDYRANGILDAINDPKTFARLATQVDPLDPGFKVGLDAVQKLIVNAIGDQFFLPNNDRYYYSQFKNKMRLQIPDAEHSMLTGLHYLHSAVAGHMRQLALKKPLPQWHHTMSYDHHTINLVVSPKPTSVALFKTFTPPSEPTRMDFRLMKANIEGGCLPPATPLNDEICLSPTWWNSTQIKGRQLDNGSWLYSYTATQDEIPADGKSYLGLFIVAAWENHPEMTDFVASTQTMVLPDKYPFDDCRPNCPSNLV